MMDTHYEMLMVKVTDHTATPTEREELMTWLSDKPELRLELEKHQALKAVTDGWMSRLEADLFEDSHRKATSTRLFNTLGVCLIVGGVLTMLGFTFFHTLTDPNAPLAIQIGLTGFGAGATILLFAVIRWRLQSNKTDRYSEVIR